MDQPDSSPARAKAPESFRRPAPGAGALSTVVLVLVAVVVLGGLATAVTYLLYFHRQGPTGAATGTGMGGPSLPEGARAIATMEPPLVEVFALHFSPDGKLLGVGDGGQGVHLYDAATGKPAGVVGEQGQPNAGGFAFLAGGRLVAVTRAPTGIVALWDVAKRQRIKRLGPGPGVAYATSPEARLVICSAAAGQKDGRLTIWGPGDSDGRSVPISGDSGENLALSGDGKLLASSGGDRPNRRIKVYRMPEVKLLHTMGKREGGMGTKLAFSPDGKLLASSGPDDLKLWDVETGEVKPPVEGNNGACACCFTADGKVLAAYHRDEKGIKLWDVATRKQRAFVPVRYVEHMTFSPKANVVAVALADRTVKLIDLTDLLK